MNENVPLLKLIRLKLIPTKKFLVLTSLGSVLLMLTLPTQYYLATRLEKINVAPSYDLILSNLPVIDSGFMEIYLFGFVLFFVLFFLILTLKWPSLIPYSLFIFLFTIWLRILFFNLTVIHEPPGALNSTAPFDAWRDLFYSGHVGLPFIAALIVPDKKTKAIFYSFTVFLAISVLVTHMHYSIDVLGGIVIPYAIFVFWEKHLKSWFVSKLFKPLNQ